VEKTHLCLLEGKVEGKRGRGRPRRNWIDDLADWTGLESYERIKRAAEN